MFERTPAIESFWRAFAEANGVDGDDYAITSFGDTPAMQDELAALVLAGTKRATAGLLRDVETGAEAMAVVGDYVVALDGGGEPALIWQTTGVEVKPLNEVTARFAWDEGEGDRTRDDWLRGHVSYFTRQAAREGWTFDERIETVFERFRVVWPAHASDQ